MNVGIASSASDLIDEHSPIFTSEPKLICMHVIILLPVRQKYFTFKNITQTRVCNMQIICVDFESQMN